MCRPRLAPFFWIWWIQWLSHSKTAPAYFSLIVHLCLMVQDVTSLFELRQNQHFFSQKQTKILLDWLHEVWRSKCWKPWGILFPGSMFKPWKCFFGLVIWHPPFFLVWKQVSFVVLGGKGSTWRGAGVETTWNSRGKRSRVACHQEWGNFPTGVGVKSPTIPKIAAYIVVQEMRRSDRN